MKQLSSGTTFFNKRIFPAVWFGGVIFIWLSAAFIMFLNRRIAEEGVMVLVIPIIMMGFGFIFFKILFANTVDKAMYDEESILITSKGKEIRIPFLNIDHIEYVNNRPPKLDITLYCSDPELGKVISVLVKSCNVFLPKHPDVVEFLEVFQKNRYRTSKD